MGNSARTFAHVIIFHHNPVSFFFWNPKIRRISSVFLTVRNENPIPPSPSAPTALRLDVEFAYLLDSFITCLIVGYESRSGSMATNQALFRVKSSPMTVG